MTYPTNDDRENAFEQYRREQAATCEKWLGLRARDSITGRKGTITGYAIYAHEETRCRMEFIDAEEVPRCEWFPLSRLVAITAP